MRKNMSIGALPLLLVAPLCAQDIAGDWQGTLKTGARDLRIVLNFAKEKDDSWKLIMYSIDQGTEGVASNSVSLQDSNIKFTVDQVGGTYEGKVSPDGTSIGGTWTQARALPLELKRATKETAWQIDPTTHSVQFITVEDNVKLEVLDWGGTGRPMILLTGQGNSAHVYDKFAPKLTGAYHVYGITRRGYGISSAPPPTSGNYSADRLGDDVLAVIDSLKLNRPVLVGHSLGGEELSSVGSRHPEKVAGLIYLDAGYSYAYYDPSRGDLNIDRNDVQRKLEQLRPGNLTDLRLIRELLEMSLPALEKDLRQRLPPALGTPKLQTKPEGEPQRSATPAPPQRAIPPIERAVLDGMQKYTDIHVPILAIYAFPHDRGITDPAARAEADARDLEFEGVQAKAFEKGLPTARVVWLAHANHYVFRSNEADVLREMIAFISALP